MKVRILLLAGALGACSPAPPREAVELARFEAAPRDRCDIARTADFEGRGAAELQRYLDGLTRSAVPQLGVPPLRVDMAIAHGAPKPGVIGVTAGEVACEADNAGFRITLYRDALLGRQLATAYRTLAHEFQHVVQIRRDGLPCGPRDGTLAAYEHEAVALAERLVPACPARGAATSAAASADR